jgi:hypothetical protein
VTGTVLQPLVSASHNASAPALKKVLVKFMPTTNQTGGKIQTVYSAASRAISAA